MNLFKENEVCLLQSVNYPQFNGVVTVDKVYNLPYAPEGNFVIDPSTGARVNTISEYQYTLKEIPKRLGFPSNTQVITIWGETALKKLHPPSRFKTLESLVQHLNTKEYNNVNSNKRSNSKRKESSP